MIKADLSELMAIKRIHDGLKVEVRDGDVEHAIKQLRRRMLTDGSLRLLAIRKSCPKRSDREKAKSRRAASHRKRWAARKAAIESKYKG